MSRRESRERMLAKIKDLNFLNYIRMSDEAHFHLNGYITNTIFVIGHRKILMSCTSVNYTTPKSQYGMLFCMMASIGLTFLNVRMVLQQLCHSTVILETFFITKLHAQNIESMWFQQDGAMSHTACQSIETFRQLFVRYVISCNGDIPCPARSPKQKIEDEIIANHLVMIKREFESFRNRLLKLLKCERQSGAHLTDVIFKK